MYLNGKIAKVDAWLSQEHSQSLYQQLLAYPGWQQHSIRMFGKQVLEPRLSSWMADEGVNYRYSGKLREASAWLPKVKQVSEEISAYCSADFNSVLLNYYRNGTDSMGWHGDNEPELGELPVIASLSLGATRRFLFRHRQTKQVIELHLADGDLLIMNGLCQNQWQHSLPKSPAVQQPRINLTFRVTHPIASG